MSDEKIDAWEQAAALALSQIQVSRKRHRLALRTQQREDLAAFDKETRALIGEQTKKNDADLKEAMEAEGLL